MLVIGPTAAETPEVILMGVSLRVWRMLVSHWIEASGCDTPSPYIVNNGFGQIERLSSPHTSQQSISCRPASYLLNEDRACGDLNLYTQILCIRTLTHTCNIVNESNTLSLTSCLAKTIYVTALLGGRFRSLALWQ
jgi:hypothetical protein